MSYPDYDEEEYVCPRCEGDKDPEEAICINCQQDDKNDDLTSEYINEHH